MSKIRSHLNIVSSNQYLKLKMKIDDKNQRISKLKEDLDASKKLLAQKDAEIENLKKSINILCPPGIAADPFSENLPWEVTKVFSELERFGRCITYVHYLEARIRKELEKYEQQNARN